MIKKQFFRGLFWLVALNLLVKPVWIFAVDREVQNRVGHEVYGSYFALFNLTYVLLFLADAGLSNLLLQRAAGQTPVSTKQLLGIKIFLLTVYIISCCFIGWLTHIRQWNVLLYLIAIQTLTSLFIFLRSLLIANQYYRTDALFSVIDKSLMIVLCSVPLYGLVKQITISLFLQIQLIATAFAVTALVLFLLKKNLFIKSKQESLLTIAKWIAPFAFIILLMSMHYRLDGFLLEQLHSNGAVQAGIYATAYRLLDAGNMIGYLTASFLVAFVARNKNNGKMVEDVLLIVRHGLLLASVIVVTFIFVFAPWVQQLLYHTNNNYNSKVIQLCVASLPAYYLVHVYGSALTGTANFSAFIRILIFSVLANVILNLWLIPGYGAIGCCISALVSQYVCGMACFLVATNKMRMSYGWRAFAFYVLAAAISFWLFQMAPVFFTNVWVILAAVLFTCFIIVAFGIKFFKNSFLKFK